MSDPIYCPAQTFAGRMYDDPAPAEYCENEVDEEGELCADHDADARMDDDYDRYLEAKYEREHDPDYYTDHGHMGE